MNDDEYQGEHFNPYDNKDIKKVDNNEQQYIDDYYSIDIKRLTELRLFLLNKIMGLIQGKIDFEIRVTDLGVYFDLYINNNLICKSLCVLKHEIQKGHSLLVKLNEEYIQFDIILYYRELVKIIDRWHNQKNSI